MKILLPAAIAAMVGSAALAQGAQAPVARPMSDGVMTRDEVVQMVRDHFNKMDADHDGVVTIEEATKGRDMMAGHMMHRGEAPRMMVMRDHDMGDPNKAFDRLDANRDGSISREEFAKAREQRIEKRIEIHEAAKDGKLEQRTERGEGRHMRMIVMADTNHDGKITLAESEAMALEHFDKMDSNHDGKVTPEERRAAMPMMIKQIRTRDAG